MINKIFWIQIYYKTVLVNFSKDNRMKMKNNNSKFRLNNINKINKTIKSLSFKSLMIYKISIVFK